MAQRKGSETQHCSFCHRDTEEEILFTGREKRPVKNSLACGAKNISFMFHKLYECNNSVRIALISYTFATKWLFVFHLPLSLDK